MNRIVVWCVATAAMLTLAGTAQSQIKIGVTVSATGPAASLGIPEKNTVAMCPRSIAGKSVEYIVLDDASDSTLAVQNAKKLISESAVDAIIGSTTTPNSLAMTDVVAEGETPTISLASSVRIIEPVDAKKAWVFKTPQTDVMMAGAILEHMEKNNVKTLGYVGFNDALGEAFFAEIDKAASARKIPLTGNERFAPKDTSVTGQALKLIAAKPDAIVIGASGTPAALPARTPGVVVSSESVRSRIRHLVGGENAHQPLSDDRIVDLLKGEGIEIARRTVAKYREAMRIPSSAERRRLGRLGMGRSLPSGVPSAAIAAQVLAGPAD